MKIDDLYDVVAFVDPASGKKTAAQRKTSSRSADVVVGMDGLGHVFVLHAWAGRVPTPAHTDRIFQLAVDWKPRIVGIDASAMQTLYSDSLLLEARHRKARLPLWPMQMPTHVVKEERIRAVLQPVIANGRLFLSAEQHDLQQEIESFPTGATKDLVDALASAITLLRKPGRERSESREREAYLAYLKATGAPASYIDRVRAAS